MSSRRSVLHSDDWLQPAVALSEDFITPTLLIRRDSRYILRRFSARLSLLKVVHQRCAIGFHSAFGQTAVRANVPKQNQVLLRIPGIETVNVRTRLPIDNELIADPNRLVILRPGELSVDPALFPVRLVWQLRFPFVSRQKCNRRQIGNR
jgi:hypothetical protein